MTVPRRGRPLGFKSFAVLRQVEQQPVTLATLARELQLSYGDTQRTVHRLVTAGRVEYGEPQRNTGGRPARVVQVSSNAEPAPSVDALFNLWRVR
jgi:predicted ArsR family transcriptional regulator